jgi:acyl carrier protein
MTTSTASHVIRIISRSAMVPEENVRPDTPLAKLGIGSLEQIECVFAVEEELKVELDQPELWQARTVQDIIDAVTRALAGKGEQPPA